MSAAKKPNTAREIVDEVFGRGMTREIWTANYDKALPISIQNFDLSAVLPAVFYMFRFGRRRGRGKFLETFGGDGTATIEQVAGKLAETEWFEGFTGPTERAILGGSPPGLLPGEPQAGVGQAGADPTCRPGALYGQLGGSARSCRKLAFRS